MLKLNLGLCHTEICKIGNTFLVFEMGALEFIASDMYFVLAMRHWG